MNMDGKPQCDVCKDALLVPNSKNRRNNVSIAVIYEDGTQRKCIMVDAGKTLRHACLEQLPKVGIHSVTSLLLTHGHADAILGLDDLRDLQQSERVEVCDPFDNSLTVHGFRILSGPLPIYATDETIETVKSVFPYLTCPPKFLDEENNVIERRVACIRLHPIPDRCRRVIDGIPVEIFPVYHGGTYISLGFNFGDPGQFVYISDVKVIPEESMAYLRSIPHIKILVLDCLDREGIWSHVGLEEAISICKELAPEYVYFTGMCCSLGLHDEIELELQSKGLTNYFLAYDGLHLQV